jgi:hypothetical protein
MTAAASATLPIAKGATARPAISPVTTSAVHIDCHTIRKMRILPHSLIR